MFFAKIVTLKSNVDQRVVDIIHKIAEAEREKAQAENRDLTEAETTRQKLIFHDRTLPGIEFNGYGLDGLFGLAPVAKNDSEGQHVESWEMPAYLFWPLMVFLVAAICVCIRSVLRWKSTRDNKIGNNPGKLYGSLRAKAQSDGVSGAVNSEYNQIDETPSVVSESISAESGLLRKFREMPVKLALADEECVKSMRNLEADGRFYELKATQQAYGPLGIVTTLSKEYSLDAMLDACESVITADKLPLKLAVLSKSEQELPMKTILGELSERNSILPEDGDEIELENPLLYFSGFHPVAMQEAIKHVKSFQAITGELMIAMAVPGAMDKSVKNLLLEVRRDFDESKRG